MINATGKLEDKYKDGVIFNVHLYSNKKLSKKLIKDMLEELVDRLDGNYQIKNVDWFYIDCDKL